MNDTLPEYVLLMKGIRTCSFLVPFSWIRNADGRLIINTDSSGLLGINEYLSGFSGGIEGFRAVLRASIAVFEAVLSLRNYFVTPEMLDLSAGRIFLKPEENNSDVKYASLCFGAGKEIYVQYMDLLDELQRDFPDHHCDLIRTRLKARAEKGKLSARDMLGILSLWLLEL